MTTSDYLNAAVDLIERKGWTQGMFHDAKGYCARGAIREVTGEWQEDTLSLTSGPSAALCRYLYNTIGHGNYADWNDAPERTKAEVVAGLRGAAVMAAEQEANV